MITTLKIRSIRSAGAIAVALTAACSTVQVGRDFDLGAFEANVQRGTTTQAQVRAWLGDPNGIGHAVDTSGEQFEEWTYYYGTGKLPAIADARFKMLQIKFDQQDRVRAYNWSQ